MSADNTVRNGGIDHISLIALDIRKDRVTGATINLTIRDMDSGEYWNGAAFVPSYNTVAMVETDVTNLPGAYHYDMSTSDRSLYYEAEAVGDEVVNGPFNGSAQFVDWIGDIIISRKYIRNKVVCDGGRYTVFDDDGSVLETGDATIMERKPDGFPPVP